MVEARPASRYPNLGRAVAGFLLAWLGGALAGFVVLAAFAACAPIGPDGGPSWLALPMVPAAALAGFGLVRWLLFRQLPGLLWWLVAAALIVLAGCIAVWLRDHAGVAQPWDLLALVLLTTVPGLAWALRNDAGPGGMGFAGKGSAE